jgi:hypothetical protein
MVDFFYSLSLWQTTILVLGVALAVGLASSIGVRKLFRLNPTEEETDIAINLMQVAAAYIGIMLAFSGVLVWQNFADADLALHREAATASQLYRDLKTYGPETIEPRKALRSYITSVIEDEWPLLKEGQRSDSTDLALQRVFSALGAIHPKDSRDTVLYQESFRNLDDLVSLRRDRIAASETSIPAILWIVGVIGSVMTVVYASAFLDSRYTLYMVSGLSLTIGLIFLFLLTFNCAFKGPVSVGNGDLLQVSKLFDKIDRFQP